MSGLSHVSVGVNDVARAKAFYDPLMKLVGPRVRHADEESVDYGNGGLVFSLETPSTFVLDADGNKIEAVTGER